MRRAVVWVWVLVAGVVLGAGSGVALGQPALAERVLVVPVEGEVGVGITAAGVDDALTRARRQKVEKVVFLVDSPGGYLYEARAIMGLLTREAEGLEIVAVVPERALSAATVFLAAADAWVVSPGAVVGAATAYGVDSTTGSVDVDAKLNGAWAAALADFAAQSGWPGVVFRAMVERDVTLYAGRTEEGGPVVFSRSWPDGAETVERIDNDGTVLSLNSTQLEQFDLATVVADFGKGDDALVEAIARVRGWGEVRSAGSYGRSSMIRAAKEREKLEEEVRELWEHFEREVTKAAETDPRGLSIYFDRDTMLMTGASQRAWAQAAAASLNHWTAAERIMQRMARLDRDAERAGAEHLRVDRERADAAYKQVAENISYLRANLRRTHYQLNP